MSLANLLTNGWSGSGAAVPNADAVENLPLIAYGNSSLTNQPQQSNNAAYIFRLPRRLGMTVTNRAIAGTYMQDNARLAIGTTASTLTPGSKGLYLIDSIGDDNLGGGHNSWNISGMQYGLDTIINAAMCSAKTAESTANFVFTGTWTNFASASCSSGALKYSSTPGDSVTITTPVGTDFGLIVYGADPTTGSLGHYTVTCDGVPVVTNQTYPVGKGYPGGGSTPTGAVVIPFRGLANAAHTIVVTVASNTLTYVDDLLTLNPTSPPQVVVLSEQYCTAAGYALFASNPSNATVDQFNTAAKAICANYPSFVTYLDLCSQFDPNKYCGSDGVHWNDAGSAFAADFIASALANLPFRAGLNTV